MAASPLKINFDLSEFDRTLKQYREASGKEMQQIVAENPFRWPVASATARCS